MARDARRGWRIAGYAVALVVSLTGCGSSAASSSTTDSPSAPALAKYVPAEAVVTGEKTVQLAPSGPPQKVVTYTSEQQSTSGFSYRDFVILSWDPFARRWVDVFDGAKVQAPTSIGQANQNDAVLPTNANVGRLEVMPIVPRPHRTDLVFWSFLNFGANGNLEVGIVHYDGQTANLAYFQTYTPANKGAPTVTGDAPHQRLSIPAGWLTTDDPQCCAVRDYVDTIGLRTQTFSNGPPSTSYVVIASTKSWLGAYVAVPPNPDGEAPPPNPIVLGVTQGGPAVGDLQPGDQLVGVSGASAPSSSTLGPPVIDEIAESLPGVTIPLEILRRGSQQVINIKLSSTASPAFSSSEAPEAGYLGVSVQSGSAPNGTQSGAVIEQVESQSPAESVGLVEGDVITSVGSTSVTSQQDLEYALYLLPPGTTVQIEYFDSSGSAQSVNVTVESYPEDSSQPTVASV